MPVKKLLRFFAALFPLSNSLWSFYARAAKLSFQNPSAACSCVIYIVILVQGCFFHCRLHQRNVICKTFRFPMAMATNNQKESCLTPSVCNDVNFAKHYSSIQANHRQRFYIYTGYNISSPPFFLIYNINTSNKKRNI